MKRPIRLGAEEPNKTLYTSGSLVSRFRSHAGWIDEGEREAIGFVAPSTRGGAILDIGVGGGRTVSLLTLLSDDYRAIDYSPTLVEVCRNSFPTRDIEIGDARDLSRYEDDSFKLVVFSYNGIDTVSHEDRQIVLHEVRRVLDPGGFFVYSTINRNGPYFDDRPWSGIQRAKCDIATLKRIVRWASMYGPDMWGHLMGWVKWWRVRSSLEDHGSWALGPLCGPGLGLIVHWATLEGTAAELDAAGMSVIALFDADGRRLNPKDATATPMFHVVARCVDVDDRSPSSQRPR